MSARRPYPSPPAPRRPSVNRALVALAALALLGTACKGGRMLGKDDDVLVDDHRAGILAWTTAVRECVESLIEDHSSKVDVQERWLALVPPIENKTGEELRVFYESILSEVERAFHEHGEYRLISVSTVEVALDSMPDVRGGRELLRQSVRERFLETMGREARVPDYLLLAKATARVSRAGRREEKWYEFHLEMVDVNTGEKVANGYGKARKGYTK